MLGVLALVPANAQAQCVTPAIHGVQISKSCTSPVNRCATDADCTDAVFCNGAEQCATEGAPGSNVVDCSITITNPSNHCDSVTVNEIADAITNGTGSPLTSSALLVTATTGTVSGPGCDVGSDLGSVASETCTLAALTVPASSITVRANYYTVQAADPDPLDDQASGTIADVCDGETTGCSTTPSVVQFTAATTLQSGCSPGTPVSCPDDGDLCNGTEFCNEDTDSCGHQSPLDCNDGLFCTDDSCVPATGCAHSAHNCADTDECTIDSCNEDTDMCDHTADPACEVTEFCRTPGFWGTHGGADPDKKCSQNITQAVLGVVGSISICGEDICNTLPDDASSALEALCVRVQGQQTRQLARQLTAARLNCIVSGETGGPCDGISINAIFDACNTACAAGDTEATVGTDEIDCIDAIDCFNNGGTFDPSDGSCDTGTCETGGAGCSEDNPCAEGECIVGESCHTQPFPEDFPLPNNALSSSDPCFEKQGPAGSSSECKESNKSPCTVIQPNEDECATEAACL
jgi:hypothetical protein